MASGSLLTPQQHPHFPGSTASSTSTPASSVSTSTAASTSSLRSYPKPPLLRSRPSKIVPFPMSPPPRRSPSTLTTQVHRTSNPFESAYGYSRAVRRGPFIYVSGTTSLSPHSITPVVLHPNSAYLQTVTAFYEALSAVEKLGGRREDVVRVRMYVRDRKDCDEVGRGMKEVFGGDGESAWAATMVTDVGFVSDEMKVEVEVDAVVG